MSPALDVLTWVAILVLGPGAVAVLLWFLRDLRSVLPDDRPPQGR